MAVVTSGFVNRTQVERAIEKVIRKLGREAVRVRYNIGTDWAGDPAIYFRIVLSDAAAKDDRLAKVAQRMNNTVFDELQPLENWGMFPYLSFRSKAEQTKLKDPAWE